MTKRIVLIVFLIIIILGSIFACHKFSSKQKFEKITFWSIQLKPIYEKQINNIIAEFEKNNPKYKVVWVDIPIQEAQKRTLASILSSTPPDLINLNPEFSQILAKKNALEFFDEIEVNDFHEGLVNKLRYKGDIYALPFYATSPITIYNKEIFDKCLNDKKIKSYDDLFKNSPQIYSCSNISPFVAPLVENDILYKILNKYNIEKFTDSEKAQAYYIFDEFNKMYKNNYLPKDTLTINHREMIEKYMSNQASLIVAGTNFIKMIKENAPDVYSKSAIAPQLVGNNQKYDVSLMNLVIPKKSKNKDMARELAYILTNSENQLELAKLTNVLPANIYALKDDYFKNCSPDIMDTARCISVKQLDNLATSEIEITDKKLLNEELNKTFEGILLDKNSDFESIKIGIDNLFPRLNSLIEQN